MDYTYQYKELLEIDAISQYQWDIFISAFNPADRVCTIFERVNACRKEWLIHSEYGFVQDDRPADAFHSPSSREDEFIVEFFEQRLPGVDISKIDICIDVTGFMRPHMLYLVYYLEAMGVKRFDVIYTEPGHYERRDATQFASENVHTVRQVAGFEGFSRSDTKNDLLIVNAGYEDQLTAEVAEDKDKARKLVMLGLPSLKADMYQQGVLRNQRARDALGEGVREFFAPAADPFATATVLSQIVSRERASHGITNLYMSPLATKPSALGFALFYLKECKDSSSSILFPFSNKYSPSTSSGLGRVWKYTIEF